MSTLLAVLLLVGGQYRMRMVANDDRKVEQGRSADGGYSWSVYCVNCSSEAGGGGLTDAELRAVPVPVSLATAPTTPVTGAFWQATQPVSASSLPLPTGASTEATLALIKAKTDNLDVALSTRTKPADSQHMTVDNASLAVTGTFFQATQPVSLASVPSHAVTGTFWQATQPVSIASMPSTPVTGTFWQATQPVSGTVTANAGTGTMAVSGPVTDAQLRASVVPVSLASTTITGTVAATQSGTWSDRVVGNAGGVIDAANNGTAPANVWVGGWQLQTGATATAGTAGQVGSPVASLDHVPYARLGGPVTWACSLDNLGATLTQCQAVGGTGLKYYITDIEIESTTTTAGLFLVRYGTGTNCGTGTTSLFPSAATVPRLSYPANTAANPSVFHFLTPLATAAAQEVCIICTATNTCSVQMTGYTAP